MQSNQKSTSTGISYSLLKRGFFIMCSLFILSFFSPQSVVMAQSSNKKGEEYYNEGCKYDKKKDYSQANKYYKKAIKEGYADAYVDLGYNYEEGRGVRKDGKKAFELYQEGSNLGSIRSTGYLGTCYYFGTGTSVDYAKAAECWQKAADAGNAAATSNLAFCYYRGNGRPQDYSKALELWEKSFKINPNVWTDYGEPEFLTGECYFNGLGTDVDFKLAKSYYEKAAKKGWQAAKDKITYKNWKAITAEANGKLVQKAKDDIASNDYAGAHKKLSAILNNDPNYEEANKYMGYLYYNGKGVEKDQKKGLDYYDKCKDDESALIVALAYLYGDRGYKRDPWAASGKLGARKSTPELRYYRGEADYAISLEKGDDQFVYTAYDEYKAAAEGGYAPAKKKLAQWNTLKAAVDKKAAENRLKAKKEAAEKKAQEDAEYKKRKADFAKLEEGDVIIFREHESVDVGVIIQDLKDRYVSIRCEVLINKDQGSRILGRVKEVKLIDPSYDPEPVKYDGEKIKEGQMLWIKDAAGRSYAGNYCWYIE